MINVDKTILVNSLCGLPCSALLHGKFPDDEKWTRKAIRNLGIVVLKIKTNGGSALAVPLSDIPPETQISYLQRKAGVVSADASPALWDTFQRSPAGNQEEAARRHPIIMALVAKIEAGSSLRGALAEIFRETGVNPQKLNRWYSRVDGKPKADWLPLLAPDWKPGGREAEISEDAWRYYAGWLGRPEQPKFRVAYRKTKDAADHHGWTLPSESTMWRRWQALDERLKVKWREGADAYDRLYPYQERARDELNAMDGTNSDTRTFDLNVVWPDGQKGRCLVVALTVDDYSGYPLAYRPDRTENGDQFRLLTAEVFENYGVPKRMTFDNTMAAANKVMSGGVRCRFRFKFKNDDIMGILPRCGVDVHFCLPRHGQSKSVERIQQELIDYVEKDPRCAGAYLGRDPTRKPANYGEKVVPVEVVMKVYAEAIEFVRNRTDRKTRVCNGRSMREAFEESLNNSPVRKPTRAQLRYLLLAAEGVKTDRDNGSIRLGQKPYVHRYWSEKLLPYRGQKVTVRFDPDKLESSIIVETLEGVVIDDNVPCLERAGVHDTAAARKFHHAKGAFKKATKELEKAQQKMTAAELSLYLPAAPTPAPLPEAKIIAPYFETKPPAMPSAPVRDRDADFEAALYMLEEKRWGRAS